MATITIEKLQKSFGDLHIIQGVDLEIQDKEFVVFVGPSGCGKSTMLRLISGLEEANDGRILIDGEDVTSLQAGERGLSMVFQSYALYPHKTVAENMGFALKVGGENKSVIQHRVQEAADILQLGPLLHRRPRELSGGQRQRVAIGRSIVRDPKAFLFDEPLSNLDASLRVQTRIQLARLHKKLDSTMIYVTHDQVEAMTLADRIVVFSGGLIEQVGPPLFLYEHPANLFVATFIGSPEMNILPCEAMEGDVVRLSQGSVVTASRRRYRPGNAAFAGIRAEHIRLCDHSDGIPGTVGVCEQLGSDTYLYVDLDSDHTVVVRTTGDVAVEEGKQVHLEFRPDFIHLFDADERALTSKPTPN